MEPLGLSDEEQAARHRDAARAVETRAALLRTVLLALLALLGFFAASDRAADLPAAREDSDPVIRNVSDLDLPRIRSDAVRKVERA